MINKYNFDTDLLKGADIDYLLSSLRGCINITKFSYPKTPKETTLEYNTAIIKECFVELQEVIDMGDTTNKNVEILRFFSKYLLDNIEGCSSLDECIDRLRAEVEKYLK